MPPAWRFIRSLPFGWLPTLAVMQGLATKVVGFYSRSPRWWASILGWPLALCPLSVP